jgi:Arc/MetJ-type ribon-helix-helix transcriptional regulator
VKKKPNPYSERMTVNLTPDQMRRLEELRNVRSRVGNFVSKNDLLRDAVNLYLAAQEPAGVAPGHRQRCRIKGRCTGQKGRGTDHHAAKLHRARHAQT